MSGLEMAAAYARVEDIVNALELPFTEIEKAKASEAGLIEFARAHNQSLDWILRGDVRVMVCQLAAKGR